MRLPKPRIRRRSLRLRRRKRLGLKRLPGLKRLRKSY